jgi:shikimate 5-dehydrogenase
MLVYQGALSFEIWTGIKAPVDEMLKAVIRRLKEAQS